MENKTFNNFNSEIAYVLALQVADKVLRKEITQEELDGVMKDLRNNEFDFIELSGTFINKKAIYFLEFQPKVNIKKMEDK